MDQEQEREGKIVRGEVWNDHLVKEHRLLLHTFRIEGMGKKICLLPGQAR